MEQKDRLSVASCWNDLKNQNIRFVFRPTRAYASLHKNLLHPRLLKKGSDRSNYLNILSRESEEKVPIPDWRPLAVLERKFIEQMDVPHFTTRADSTSIPLNNGKEIAGYFEHSAFHNACLRLNGLNECDLERQVRFIEGALNCRSGSNSKHNNTEFSKRHGGMLTPEMALQQGKEIAKTLINSAIRADDGSITWIAPRPIGVSGKHQLDPISLDLYGGTAGIALFFAAMYRITLKDEYKDCVAGALKTVIDNAWKFQTTSDCASRNIGGFAGLGSLAYSLMQCGQLTGLSELKIAAEATAFRISHSIDYDRKFDLMYGAAGAILSLSKVHEHSGEPELLKAMTHAGHHLLQHRKRSDSGHWIWCGSEGNFLTGYSHGAAGIAQALVRLSAATGAKKFSDAAREAIDWENRSFHFAKTNWTDYRQPIENATEQSSRNRFMTAWCHGAAGIGLSRLEILKNISSTEIEHDVLRALATTRKVVNSKTDYLCCGNFGRLELLMNASQHLTDSSLAQEALKSAGMLLQRARASGGYRYHPAIGYTPGFFQGISGIGYQMLRMTHPELIPSVLTLS
jgi:type 2 lantibiotic biosynthesis protein LanM